MFYLIGLGLGDAEDITVKGLKIVRRAKRVYLEAYTSMLTVGKEALEEFYGREVILADREMVEQQSYVLFEGADTDDIVFLVVGDPLGATTHSDLVLRAKEKNIPYQLVHNASIMNAIGCCGLQLYNFGWTVSIVFWEDNWKPDSFYDRIARNIIMGFHTLCLLDIKVKEQTIDNLMRGRKVYEPPRYMTVAQAATQLLEIIRKKKAEGQGDLAVTEHTLCVGAARIGSETQCIKVGTIKQLSTADLGGPLHSMVIVGHMHPMEEDMLKTFTDDHAIFSQDS